MSFIIHTHDTAPDGAKPWIESTQKKFGMVPNLFALMAEAPALLEGYVRLSALFFQNTDLSDTERQIVLMTASRLNGCAYCMTGHSVEAEMQGVDMSIVESMRNRTELSDPKLEALRKFTEIVVTSRGWPSDQDVADIVAAGYTQQTVLEVVLGVGLKTLSNYTNHIVKTPLDAATAHREWKADTGQV
ncbi:carboxymuconolactone decarboxylase family protein [Ruegeria sp. EL01]|uniref:carboxymuconolactone decarboxylase family protein n=1 Tax=Ruegeria sp. EL01 TaxID=2107578 RepID=UPI000EA8213B|nr:carboxymuconolactone decarboxylase family protein [Ruegeria sp. EL01]